MSTNAGCILIHGSELGAWLWERAVGKLGLVPEVGTSWVLTRVLGYRRAFEYYEGGEHIDAQRALELGLVNEVVSGDELMDATRRWCDRISELPPHALPIAKPLLRGAADASWEQAPENGGVRGAAVLHDARFRGGSREGRGRDLERVELRAGMRETVTV